MIAAGRALSASSTSAVIVEEPKEEARVLKVCNYSVSGIGKFYVIRNYYFGNAKLVTWLPIAVWRIAG